MDDTTLANELLRVEHERDRLVYWLLKLHAERNKRRPYRRPWNRVRSVLEDVGYDPESDRAHMLLHLGEPTRELEDDHGEDP